MCGVIPTPDVRRVDFSDDARFVRVGKSFLCLSPKNPCFRRCVLTNVLHGVCLAETQIVLGSNGVFEFITNQVGAYRRVDRLTDGSDSTTGCT